MMVFKSISCIHYWPANVIVFIGSHGNCVYCVYCSNCQLLIWVASIPIRCREMAASHYERPWNQQGLQCRVSPNQTSWNAIGLYVKLNFTISNAWLYNIIQSYNSKWNTMVWPKQIDLYHHKTSGRQETTISRAAKQQINADLIHAYLRIFIYTKPCCIEGLWPARGSGWLDTCSFLRCLGFIFEPPSHVVLRLDQLVYGCMKSAWWFGYI